MPESAAGRSGTRTPSTARGGTLHQHLPDLTALEHSQSERPFAPTHSVSVTPGSLLHRLSDADVLGVNSYHHQAVDRLGAGLAVCATAPDGTVEAVWDPAARFCLGVQWHPEVLTHRADHAPLFESFVAAARGAAPAPALALVA